MDHTPYDKTSGDHSLPTHPHWTDEQEQLITAPYTYLASVGGKNLRSQLISLFNGVLQIPSDKLAQISKIIEMLHTASLLIDDIEDGSTLRRGKPSAHLVYGTPYVINSSNYMYFLSLQETLALGNTDCIRAFNEELLNLHRGQSLDLYWRDNLIIPPETQYFEMVMNKTGGLFRLAVRMMECFSEVDVVSLVPLSNILGIIYQVKDDYLNLQGETLQKNKGFCEDISEGKLSFPIIHSLRSTTTDNSNLLDILKLKTEDDKIKHTAIEILKSTQSFEYTLNMLNLLKTKAHDWVSEAQAKCTNSGLDELNDNLKPFHTAIDTLSQV
ncbi:CYFA0S28e00672g1_1 [Cyberlindnera fabianii]|uniref:CYFA0S28e00672g1_1 n=2 Tax=Cyberlindnera fabianii TaxID=36022 RepID=A0A061BAZ0_CYBFA|nr:CYFA0S28e00672g1_1 [Cyberlindnera fabianii]